MIANHKEKSRASIFRLVHERQLWRRGYVTVAGVDEVGRGAWAGPLVAAAVLISKDEVALWRRQKWFWQVADSKQLSPKVREEIVKACRGTVRSAVGVVEPGQIDTIGIGNANRQAMYLAVKQLHGKPRYVLTDYVPKLGTTLAGVPASVLVDGDVKVFSVALASIIAKVYRDQLMVQYEARYPGYGFAQHKGYGTRQHRAALARLGPCPLHRRSYRPVAAVLVH